MAATEDPGIKELEPAAGKAAREPSTRRALAFVYVGYAFRYLYLAILVPFYARVLGAAEYGRLLTAMGLFQIVWMVTEYGFPSAGVREVARAGAQGGEGRLYARHAAGRLVTLLPALAIGAFGTLLSPLLRERPEFGALATLCGVLAAFNMSWYFQGRLQFRTSVLLEVLGFTINVSLVLLLVREPGDAHLVLVSLSVASLICTGLAHVLALRGISLRDVRLTGGVALVREATPLFIHRGLGMIVASSSTYLVSLHASPAEVGWYGAAERIAAVGLGLLSPANQVLIGTVSRRLGLKGHEASGFLLMRQGLFALTSFGLVMLAGAWLLAGTVVPIVLGPEFAASVPILLILSLMFPFAAFAQVVNGYVLIPLRHDWTVSRVGMFGAGLTLVLILFLSKLYGGSGVAWARTLGSMAMAFTLVQVLRHKQLLGRVLGAPGIPLAARLRGDGT